MKTLFVIIVIIAGMYLFIQQSGLEKLRQFLPQQQIEQAAKNLLTNVNKNVDQKLELFKSDILSKKNTRISALEEKLASLQTQFRVKKESTKVLFTQPKQNHIQKPQDFLTEQALAPTQYLTAQSTETQSATSQPMIAQSKTAQPSDNHIDKHLDQQRAIKRQANLQDIAERMNKTSLLALTR